MVSVIEARIGQHSHSVASGDICRPEGPCPQCHAVPRWFKVHERSTRSFRFIVESVVHTIASVLLRWKCPVCGKTFTDYSDFAWPYKRGLLPRSCAETRKAGAWERGNKGNSCDESINQSDTEVKSIRAVPLPCRYQAQRRWYPLPADVP